MPAEQKLYFSPAAISAAPKREQEETKRRWQQLFTEHVLGNLGLRGDQRNALVHDQLNLALVDGRQYSGRWSARIYRVKNSLEALKVEGQIKDFVPVTKPDLLKGDLGWGVVVETRKSEKKGEEALVVPVAEVLDVRRAAELRRSLDESFGKGVWAVIYQRTHSGQEVPEAGLKKQISEGVEKANPLVVKF
jgi:hypothetical protein